MTTTLDLILFAGDLRDELRPAAREMWKACGEHVPADELADMAADLMLKRSGKAIPRAKRAGARKVISHAYVSLFREFQK